MSLYQEDDHQRLTTDPTIYTPSSDGRLLGYLPYRTGITPAFRRDAIIVGPRPLVPQTPSQAAAMQQHQQQLAQQQNALGMPQTTGTPISMQQQLKKLPSGTALNMPQMRISSNGNLRPPATPILTAITPAPLVSPQSSPTPTAPNGQSSPAPILPALNGSDDSGSSATPAPQQDSAPPSAEATPAGASTASSPMPMKPTQPHHAISIPNGYHPQNSYTLPNGTATYILPGTQPNGFPVQQIPLKNVFTNGQPEMAIAVNGSRPAASYIGHAVSNATNFSLPAGAVGVNVGINLTNMNLKLPPTRTPWATAQRSPQAVAIAHSLSPHMHAHSPTPQVSPPRSGQTPTASPSLHQQQVVSGSGATY
jgi:enhancer of polycomb-like protein